jgi:hypothetical protein
VGEIEAPILFNFPDAEVFVSLTLMRHLENERKPFDAYVFPNEAHLKWQSAHREALYRRLLRQQSRALRPIGLSAVTSRRTPAR